MATKTVCKLTCPAITLYSEVLGTESPYVVQITDESGAYVSLHDLDGERIDNSNLGPLAWEVAAGVPKRIVDLVAAWYDWEALSKIAAKDRTERTS